MSAQTIFSELQEGDNKKLWAYAQELAEFRRTSSAPKGRRTVDFDDKNALRLDVMEHLYEQSDKGNAQASEKLAKIAGLTEKSQDILIQVVDFSNAYEQDNITTTTTEELSA